MNWATQYVGIPYVLNARGDEDGGLDCWGLVRKIYHEQLGINLPSYGIVSADDTEAVAEALSSGKDAPMWERVQIPRVYDLVGIYGRVKGARHINHVGVYIGNNQALHANGKSHSAVERVDSSKLRLRLAGFWRYKHV